MQAFIPRLYFWKRWQGQHRLFLSVESLLLKPLVVFRPKIQVAFQLYHTCSLSKYLSTTRGNKRVFSITSTATNRVKRRRSQSSTSSIWGPHPQTPSSSWKPLDQRKWKIKHILTLLTLKWWESRAFTPLPCKVVTSLSSDLRRVGESETLFSHSYSSLCFHPHLKRTTKPQQYQKFSLRNPKQGNPIHVLCIHKNSVRYRATEIQMWKLLSKVKIVTTTTSIHTYSWNFQV